MRIRTQILAGCLTLTALTSLMGGYAQYAQRDLGALALRIYDQSFMGMSYLRSAQVGFSALATAIPAGKARSEDFEAVVDDLRVAEERAMSPAGAAAARAVSGVVDRLRDERSGPSIGDVQSQFEEAVETFAGDGFRYRESVAKLVAADLTRGWMALALTLVAALGITVVLGRLISPPIRRAVGIAQAIAGGKLDNIVPSAGRGETADLLRALSIMQGSIAGALARIRALMAEQETTHAGALAAEHARLEAALENMNQGLCLFGSDGRLAISNRRFGSMFGMPRPGETVLEVMGRSGLGLLSESLHGGCEAALSFELSDGRSLAVSQRPVDGGGWVVTFEDTTERRAAEARLSHAARHDTLTGLPNRLLLAEMMRRASEHEAGEMALFCLGLDRFKNINETLGHGAGDMLLHQVAERLRGCVNEKVSLFRLGGDEFALLQSSFGDPVEATMLARRALENLVRPFEIEGRQVVIGASVGIALTDERVNGGEALLQCADMAMRRAKAEGRGTIRFFAAEVDAAMQLRRALELDLRHAVAEGQFEVFYQPLVQARGIAGFEALLRWHHPVRGIVSPALFIPVAEEAGLIGQIGNWVLRQACQDASKWPGLLKVAVNLSPAQFTGGSLAIEAASALRDAGLAANRLELEITESALMGDDAVIASTLQALRELGIRIAMDDFGTGYSSLSYLLRFRFDKIKIDQSFVRGMTEHKDSRAIVRAVIGLGKALGISVNAEGVETQQQLDALRSEGCGELQGYLFSKPQPVARVPEMLQRLGNATVVGATVGESSPGAGLMATIFTEREAAACPASLALSSAS